MEHSNWNGELPLPSYMHRKNSRNRDANLENLPPAVERKVRNLQNFFPLPRLPEEEEGLEDDKEAEAPLPEASWDDWGPECFADWAWRDCWEN